MRMFHDYSYFQVGKHSLISVVVFRSVSVKFTTPEILPLCLSVCQSIYMSDIIITCTTCINGYNGQLMNCDLK